MLAIVLHAISLAQPATCGIDNSSVVRAVAGRERRRGSVVLLAADAEASRTHGRGAHEWRRRTNVSSFVVVECVSAHNSKSCTSPCGVHRLHC